MNENLPAFVVLISQGTGKNPDQPIFARLWGSGFLPSQHQGVQLPRRRGSRALSSTTPPASAATDRRAHARRPRRAQPALRRANVGDPEIRRPHRANTKWPSACRPPCPNSPTSPTNPPPPSTSTARSRASPAPTPPTACSPAAWPSAACASSSSSTAAGTSTATITKQLRQPVPRHRPAVRRAHHRPQTARPARRHARRLGRRIRPHRLLARARSAHRRRPRPPRPLLHHLDGRRRRQRRHQLRATDDFCYNIVENPVHIHDLHATILHCLGIDHNRFTFRFQGLDQKLTGVEPARVVSGVLA